MAIVTFLLASFVGLLAGGYGVFALGLGFLTGVGIYMAIAVLLPLLMLLTMAHDPDGDDADGPNEAAPAG